MTITTRVMVSNSVNCTSRTEARIVWVRSLNVKTLICRRYGRRQTGKLVHDPADRHDVGAWLLEDDEEHGRVCRPPGRPVSCPGDRSRLDRYRARAGSAVAISDDDVVPILGPSQLIVWYKSSMSAPRR
jgi:hypothetical protein